MPALEIRFLPLMLLLLLELLNVSLYYLTALFHSLVSVYNITRCNHGLLPVLVFFLLLPVCVELYLENNNDMLCIFFMSVNADAMVKGVSVNGIYDSHSGNGHVVPEHISYREAVSGNFTSMDTMDITYCEENGIPGWYFLLP